MLAEIGELGKIGVPSAKTHFSVKTSRQTEETVPKWSCEFTLGDAPARTKTAEIESACGRFPTLGRLSLPTDLVGASVAGESKVDVQR